MNNAEVIKGLEKVIEGLTEIKSALKVTGVEIPGVVEETVAEVSTVAETKVAEVAPTTYKVDELKSMKYNEFKKLAAQLGVKCTGSRDEILERIVELGVVEDSEVTKEDNKVTEEEDSNESTTDYSEMADSIIESTGISDIISALEDVGIKANKNNVKDKLIIALEKNLLDVEDEEDDSAEDFEYDEEEVEDTEDEEEVDSTTYFEDFDFGSVNDPKNMTGKRLKATQKVQKGILENENLSIKQINAFLETVTLDSELEEVGEDEDSRWALYIELNKALVDDDGEVHQVSDPYEINGEPMCCGHKLKYSSKNKTYICEVCGTEYEAE